VDAAEADPMNAYIGRCRDCRTVVRVVRDHNHRTDLVPCPNGCTRGTNGNGTARRAWVQVKRIRGTFSETVQCGDRCTNAVGPSCDCHCAGTNHGAGHTLQEV
jgi:hypothetical protein